MTAISKAEPDGPGEVLRHSAAEPAVEVAGLTRDFGRRRALDEVTFSVGRGEVFGLLGPNGAGKTTAMRILLTLLRPTAGRAWVTGLDVVTQPTSVRSRVGWVPRNGRRTCCLRRGRT